MTPKNVLRLFLVLLLLALVTLVGWPRTIFKILCFCILGAAAYVRFCFCRCPACGRLIPIHFGKINITIPDYCEYCDNALY